VELGEDAYLTAGFYWCDNREFWNEATERAPLNLRAWVCQERHLSSRIIHFSDTQLFWECYEGTACENYPSGLPEWAVPDWSENTSILRQDLYQLRLQKAGLSLKGLGIPRDSDTGPPPDYELYFSWAVFRIHYTACAITKDEDKLVAIRGTEQQLGHALGDQLIAGLWYNRLLEELCWFKRIYKNGPLPRNPAKWRAPTWSWASSNARIWASNTAKSHRYCQNKQIWGELDNVNVTTNTSGELEHASLRIRCKPIPAAIEPHPSSDKTDDHTLYGILTLQNSMVKIQVEPSGESEFEIEMDDFGREEIRYVHMMIIQRCPHLRVRRKADDGDDDDIADLASDCVEGLLLVAQQGCDYMFERVGLFTANGSPTVAKVLEEYEAAESKIIIRI
jgi:hypothetical protein